MKKKFFMLLTALAILAIAGCQNSVQTDGPMLTVTDAPEATNTPEPTPTEESEPTVTPEPTATPEPTPTEEPKAASRPEPTPTEKPEPTATPEATPTPTEELKPTATPEPTSTPEPTPTSMPTPKPTEKPKATPTPKPTATLTPKPTEKPKDSKKVGIVMFKQNAKNADYGDGRIVYVELSELYSLMEEYETKEGIDAELKFYDTFEYEIGTFEYDTGETEERVTIAGLKDKGTNELVVPSRVTVLLEDYEGYKSFGYSWVMMGDGAFKGYTELVSVEIDGVLDLGDNAFEGCTNLRTLKANEDLRVGKYAFKDCVNLETVSAYTNVFVEEGGFYNCSSLREFVFEGKDNQVWGYVLGMGYVHFESDAYKAFYGCKSLKTFNWSGCYVPDEAFYGCESLENFGTSIYYIRGGDDKEWEDLMFAVGKRAFYGCKNFNIDIEGVALGNGYDIGEEAFYGCESLTNKIEVGTSKHASNSDTKYSDVICIGDRAFYGCKNLTSVEIGGYCEYIGDEAFYGCGNLTDLYIEDSDTDIGENAFYGTQYDGDLEPWFEEWDSF